MRELKIAYGNSRNQKKWSNKTATWESLLSRIETPTVTTENTAEYAKIWCECFGQSKDSLKPFDSYAIAAIMMHFEDWEKTNQRVHTKLYGRQRIYQRKA